MMGAANRRSDAAGPVEALDLVGAVQLWTGAWQHGFSVDDRQRICRTMMDVANKLSDVHRSEEQELEGALTMWRGLAMLDLDPGDRDRVVLTMMAAANRTNQVDDPNSQVDASVELWSAVASWEPEERERVVATMSHVAGLMADAGRVVEALTIWRGLAAEHGLVVQPRVLSGLGHVYQRQGRPQQAHAAFLAALEADPDNQKAESALGSPSEQFTERIYDDLPATARNPQLHDGRPAVDGLTVPAALRRIAAVDWGAAGIKGLDPESVRQVLEYTARELA